MNIHGYKKSRWEMRMMIEEEKDKEESNVIKINRLEYAIKDCNRIIKELRRKK